MRIAVRPLAALALALALSACTASPGAPAASAGAAASSGPSTAASAAAKTPKPTAAPRPTPAASHAAPATPASTPVGTTQTPWGAILDAVPPTFPVFPGAAVADPPPDGAVSGAWVADAPADEVATWYRDALQAANWAKVDLGSALEDGSRVLDVQGDLPECKAQVTVKPAGGSTMVTVLLGAGCAGAGDG